MWNINLRINNLKTRFLHGIEGCGGDVTIYPSVELKVSGGGILSLMDELQLRSTRFFVQQMVR